MQQQGNQKGEFVYKKQQFLLVLQVLEFVVIKNFIFILVYNQVSLCRIYEKRSGRTCIVTWWYLLYVTYSEGNIKKVFVLQL